MAIFNFITKSDVHSGHNKLLAFNFYLMTLMKLMLNLSPYGLAFALVLACLMLTECSMDGFFNG